MGPSSSTNRAINPTTATPKSSASPSPQISSSPSHATGLSTAAQTGIGIGITLFVLTLGLVVGLCLFRRRRRRQASERDPHAGSPPEVQEIASGVPPNETRDAGGGSPLKELEGDPPAYNSQEIAGPSSGGNSRTSSRPPPTF